MHHRLSLSTWRSKARFFSHYPRFLCIPPKLCHSIDSTSPPVNDLSRLLQGRIPRAHLLQLHARIFRLNAHQSNLIATRLIGHYHSNFALRVFRLLRQPNIFPFNAIIRVLAEEGSPLRAFSIFKELKFRPLLPNELTFSFLLKACSRDGVAVDCVRQLHCHVLKSGFNSDSFVCNGLLMVYAKMVKDLRSARQVFDDMPDRNLVCCWTSLISGYAKLGSSEDALNLFTMMLDENLLPESDTMVSVLSACSSLTPQHLDKWVKLMTHMLKECNNLAADYVNIVLVYVYGKCRKVEQSRVNFDEISDKGKRSILSWNTMIGTYVQNGCALEALTVFKSMMENYDCCPNHVTMVSILSACAEIGDLDLGIWVHNYMRTSGKKHVLSSNVNLATALIDMYSKCGHLDAAREVFAGIVEKDVVSFNAMIIGLAVNGKGDEALRLFSEMQELRLLPDSGTFLGVLSACSHSGLLDKGREIFDEMTRKDSLISPKLEHYSCYIDLLARSGYIEEALGVVSCMPFEANKFVWGAILAGSVLHNRLEIARNVSSMLVGVDPENSGGYVMLSNSFASDLEWRSVSKLRGVMREKGVVKERARSWINIGGVVHEFLAGSALHDQNRSIYQVMESLFKEMRLSSS
ncbi:hypothetical protein ACP275_02G040000 [Erythranthe tilingii]